MKMLDAVPARRSLTVVLSLVVFLAVAGAGAAEFDAPCGVTYDWYLWSALGAPVPVASAAWRCKDLGLLQFGDVQTPP